MANNRPDWGAALQSLGQSLSGYAQQDYERKRLAYEQERARQQQLADREYADTLYNTRLEADRKYKESLDPFVNTPSQMENIGGWGVMPGQPGIDLNTLETQNPDWFPALPSQPIRMRQSELNQARVNYNVGKINFAEQQQRDAAAQAARLDQINATVAGRQASDAAKLQGKNSVWGDIPKDAFEAIVNAGVAKEETDRMGSGFKSDVYKKLLEYAASGFTIDAAAEAQAEREVRAAYTPNYLSNGMELGYAPDVNGGELYYPSLTAYTPGRANTGTGPDWLYRDQKPSLDAKELTGATAENKLQTQPPTKERLAKELFAPDLEKGYVTVAQLKAYAKKLDVPWEQLSVWIPEAIAKADEQEKIGSALSKRAIAQEQTGFVFNPDDYQ
jgi:hypothetical protein